jgi:hypothetical protein
LQDQQLNYHQGKGCQVENELEKSWKDLKLKITFYLPIIMLQVTILQQT